MVKTLAEHIFAREDQGIGLKTAIMEYAAISRGLPYRRLDRSVIIVQPPGQHPVPFRNMNGPSCSHVGRHISNSKDLSRQLLSEAGLTVPATRTFTKKQLGKAWAFAQDLPGNSVIKPRYLSRGRGVTTDITTKEAFEAAWNRAFDAYDDSGSRLRVIVEAHATGDDFRCFAVGGKFISATQRRRPMVVGDGESTLSKLISRKNEIRAASPSLHTYPIPTDMDKLDNLKLLGLTLDYVPHEDEDVVLRNTSNLSGGGDSVDFTDSIHPGFKDIAIKALEATPGVEYAGVDIIAPSISVPPTASNYVVTEVEFAPGPITDFPIEGAPRNMAGAILEHYISSQRTFTRNYISKYQGKVLARLDATRRRARRG